MKGSPTGVTALKLLTLTALLLAPLAWRHTGRRNLPGSFMDWKTPP